MAQPLIKKLRSKINEAVQIWRHGGVSAEGKYLRLLYTRLRERQAYRTWLQQFGTPDGDAVTEMTETIRRWHSQPLLSIVVPVYNTDEKWLRLCLGSVLRQIYPHWELCIADDASTSPHVRTVLEEFARSDERIKIVVRTENGHISAASNSALELATGEFTVLLDHDDELSMDALYWVANEINAFPDTAMIFSDDDLIDESGTRYDPKFKPDFSRDLFYSANLVTHLSAFRTDVLRRIGGFRIGYEGSQDYDLALRFIDQIDDSQIRHIPRILYHWRVIEGSVAFSMDEKPYAHDRARKAIREHLERSGKAADVVEASHHLHRVRYKMPDPAPSVCVIVSVDDAGHHHERDDLGADYQMINVANPDADSLNNTAASTGCEVLLFLHDNVRIRTADAIGELVRFAIQPEIGAVAGKILGADMFVEQAGLVIQSDLSIAYAHRDHLNTSTGNISRNLLVGNFSAVSMSCMAISRKAFESVGGFDRNVPPGMMDVDLCLRLRETGKRIVVVPDAEFIRQGSQRNRESSAEELARFRERWAKYSAGDPMCNPNLMRDGSFRIRLDLPTHSK